MLSKIAMLVMVTGEPSNCFPITKMDEKSTLSLRQLQESAVSDEATEPINWTQEYVEHSLGELEPEPEEEALDDEDDQEIICEDPRSEPPECRPVEE